MPLFLSQATSTRQLGKGKHTGYSVIPFLRYRPRVNDESAPWTLALSFEGPAVISPRMSILCLWTYHLLPPSDCFDCSQAMIIIYIHRMLGDTPDFPPWILSSETIVKMVSINCSKKMDASQ